MKRSGLDGWQWDAIRGTWDRLASRVEERLPIEPGMRAKVITHLEALEDHADVHTRKHYTGTPG